MEGFGWIIALIVLVFLGRSGGGLFASGSVSVVDNAKPTPDGLPATTVQNQKLYDTANAPTPWSSGTGCGAPSNASALVPYKVGTGIGPGQVIPVSFNASLPLNPMAVKHGVLGAPTRTYVLSRF